MSHVHYSSDAGTIHTTTAQPATLVCFQTMPDCRGHFLARVYALTDASYVKVWEYSVRFKRIGSTTPVLSTPMPIIIDGDQEAANWAVNFTASADGLICIMVSGSDIPTTWIGNFDGLETCTEVD